jgi:hypothetical protein
MKGLQFRMSNLSFWIEGVQISQELPLSKGSEVMEEGFEDAVYLGLLDDANLSQFGHR